MSPGNPIPPEELLKATFKEVVQTEQPSLAADSDLEVDLWSAAEPWVSFIAHDYVGLALSGGGIRSATFNLGVLQGLNSLNLLEHIDYLSTVSGGGYVGGFWSKWLVRRPTGDRAMFPQTPTPSGATDSQIADTPEIRHLREFSRFLSPRLGFFETPMWHAVLAFFGGLLPALVGGLGLIAWVLTAWMLGTVTLGADPTTATVATAVLVAAVIIGFELWWRALADDDTRRAATTSYLCFAVLALMGVVVAHQLVAWWFARRLAPVLVGGWATYLTPGAGEVFPVGLGQPSGSPRTFYLPLFDVTLACLLCSFALAPVWIVARNLRASVAVVNSLERVVMRLLGLAVMWAGVALVWQLGINLHQAGIGGVWAAVTAATSGGVLGLLRNWLVQTFRPTGHKSRSERLRPLVPQLLAYLAIVAAAIGLASALAGSMPAALAPWWALWLFLSLALAAILVLDPTSYSLHSFYRDRIGRAYLGAADARTFATLAIGRASDRRPTDDLPLSDLSNRPLHLICCAANDLTGDQVETLARGARSGTLSKHGTAIGGLSRASAISVGDALTASAAAFNPVMGSLSKQLGPAVTYVLASMNLRLGFWTLHPAAPGGEDDVWAPGWRFFKELLGMTRSGVRLNSAGTAFQPATRDVHLSDGGHFDNLGLYELVRRHCRYIVVSDCGADPDLAFDDLANSVRRIREDFGVEVEVDVEPLTRAVTADRQHAVVGTIHYDRKFDKGVLIYIKPTLSGNEPPDVTQYHSRNGAFPHESTVDQFYDEAQWESYRRLGLHSTLECFRFVERLGEVPSRDAVFTGARQEWYPTPPDLRARVLSMTERFSALEQRIRENAAGTSFLAELYPETLALKTEYGAKPSASPLTDIGTVMNLLQVLQVMEDVWTGCDLDTEWRHPLNVGWINTFARWATAPSFVAWWPLLAPNFSPGFQRFIRERFYSGFPHAPRTVEGTLRQHTATVPDGLANDWLTTRLGMTWKPEGREVYEFLLELPGLDSARAIQSCLLLVSSSPGPGGRAVKSWTSDDFFVPPSLWGAGIGDRFLQALLAAWAAEPVDHCDVHVLTRIEERDAAHRQERITFTEFYRAHKFRTVERDAAHPPELLKAVRRLDTWVTLRWTP